MQQNHREKRHQLFGQKYLQFIRKVLLLRVMQYGFICLKLWIHEVT